MYRAPGASVELVEQANPPGGPSRIATARRGSARMTGVGLRWQPSSYQADYLCPQYRRVCCLPVLPQQSQLSGRSRTGGRCSAASNAAYPSFDRAGCQSCGLISSVISLNQRAADCRARGAEIAATSAPAIRRLRCQAAGWPSSAQADSLPGHVILTTAQPLVLDSLVEHQIML